MSDPLLDLIRNTRRANGTFAMRNQRKDHQAEIKRLNLAHQSGWTLSGSEVWRFNYNAVRVLTAARRENA